MNMMNLNVNMDTVINKLRNTVSTVTQSVSQLSVVLPGNPVTREFEVTAHICSAGPGLLWKVYSAQKKSTRQEAAVFVFEKKQLERWARKDRDAMVELLKKGVSQLTRLKHPRVLTVQHPLEESRDSLAFATEPVFASLANVLGEYNNMPEENGSQIKEYKLQEIEIKYGLLQVCEGITFLNNDAKILHGNLCPESVMITKQNSWKIFGLDFCLSGVVSGQEVSWPSKSYDVDAQYLTQPCLDYLAPEMTTSMSLSTASDIFSLGMLMYTCYNGGKPMFANRGDWNRHRQNIIVYNQLPDSKLLEVPSELKYFIKRLLSFNPSERPDSHEFSKLEYLHDQGVNTLSYLDSLFQWDNLEKSKFYKGLAEVLPGLPHRVRLLRVVPCLAQEFVNPSMVPFVLPNVLKIAEWSTNEEYVAHVLPYLKDVMKLREPVQVLFIFMKYMEMLLQKTPPDVTKSDVLPLIYGSLESDSPQVQELCLSIIPSFAGLIDYPAMKNSLLPRIRKLVISTQSLSVRVNCLVCLGKILDHLDKWMVMDYILPFLTEIPSRDPAVIMGIVGIYKLAVNHRKLGVTKEIVATRILPFIFPLSIENGLTTQQFSTIMSFIYDMIKQVETEQKAKLDELGAIAKEREQMKAEMNSHPVFRNELSASSDIFDDFASAASGDKINPKPPIPQSTTMPLIPSSSSTSSPNNSSYDRRSSFQQSQPKTTPALAPKTNDLMSSLISSNLTQIRHQSPSMSVSASMPLGFNSPSTNGATFGMLRSPTMAPNPVGNPNSAMMTRPMTSGAGPVAQPNSAMGFGNFQHARPPTQATLSNFSGLSSNTNNNSNPSFGHVMQPIPSAAPPVLNNSSVKSLSKRDIDDLLN